MILLTGDLVPNNYNVWNGLRGSRGGYTGPILGLHLVDCGQLAKDVLTGLKGETDLGSIAINHVVRSRLHLTPKRSCGRITIGP
jgi:hypothetical protein